MYGITVPTVTGMTNAYDVCRESLTAMRSVLVAWGVTSVESMRDWLRNKGRRARIGKRLGDAALRELWAQLSAEDARVLLLRRAIQALVVEMGRSLPAAPAAESRKPVSKKTHLPQEVPSSSWISLDDVDLRSVFRENIKTVQYCPAFIRGQWRHALCLALQARQEAAQKGCSEDKLRAWKLFDFLPILLLHRPRSHGKTSFSDSEISIMEIG